VIAKLILIVSVLIVGATVLRPVLTDDTATGDLPLIAGSAYEPEAVHSGQTAKLFREPLDHDGRVRGYV
jgi:hypothetical protein